MHRGKKIRCSEKSRSGDVNHCNKNFKLTKNQLWFVSFLELFQS